MSGPIDHDKLVRFMSYAVTYADPDGLIDEEQVDAIAHACADAALQFFAPPSPPVPSSRSSVGRMGLSGNLKVTRKP